MPRHATKTSFKKGQVSPAKGIKRPDVALRNKLEEQKQAVSKACKGREVTWGDKIRQGVLKAYAEGRLIPMVGELNPQYGKTTTENQRNSARKLFKKLNKDPIFQVRRLTALRRWHQDHKAETSQILKERNKNLEFIRKRLKGLCRKPTEPEQWLIDLISEYKLPYKYVGDGSVIIGGLNPDFINVNGRKKIIELFGRMWHDTLLRENDWKRSELGRIMAFKPYGFDTLILWDDELDDKDAIVNKITKFNKRR